MRGLAGYLGVASGRRRGSSSCRSSERLPAPSGDDGGGAGLPAAPPHGLPHGAAPADAGVLDEGAEPEAQVLPHRQHAGQAAAQRRLPQDGDQQLLGVSRLKASLMLFFLGGGGGGVHTVFGEWGGGFCRKPGWRNGSRFQFWAGTTSPTDPPDSDLAAQIVRANAAADLALIPPRARLDAGK